jgi:hypothetical protein
LSTTHGQDTLRSDRYLDIRARGAQNHCIGRKGDQKPPAGEGCEKTKRTPPTFGEVHLGLDLYIDLAHANNKHTIKTTGPFSLPPIVMIRSSTHLVSPPIFATALNMDEPDWGRGGGGGGGGRRHNSFFFRGHKTQAQLRATFAMMQGPWGRRGGGRGIVLWSGSVKPGVEQAAGP